MQFAHGGLQFECGGGHFANGGVQFAIASACVVESEWAPLSRVVVLCL